MDKFEKFRTMVRLALIDDQFETKEKEYIEELAQMHGLSSMDLNKIIDEELNIKDQFVPSFKNMSSDSKVEILADLVRMMKIDGEVYLSEIKFCEAMAEALGFKSKSVGFLSKNIHADPSIPPNWMLIQSQMKRLVV